MATRQENMKKIHNRRNKISISKIKNLTEGMFSFEYKKANGKFNIQKIAQDTGLSRNTVSKHINKLYSPT